MPVNSVLAPYPTFFDASGAPLENGLIYIGQPGFEARSTPKASFFDVGLTIPTGTASGAAIRTKGGFPINNSNAPAMFYVDGDFSISVCDRNGVLLYSALNATLALNVGAAVAPVQAADGSLGAVGIGFANEANTGFVRSGAGTMQTVINGVLVSQQTTAGTVFQQPVSGAGFTSGVLTVAQPLDADLTQIAGLARARGDLIRGGASAWERVALGPLGQFLRSDGTDATWQGGGYTWLAAQASTSGTTFDFTGIPTWATDVILVMDQLRITAGSIVVQLRTGGAAVTTGYVAVGGTIDGASTATTAPANGFGLLASTALWGVIGDMTFTKWPTSNLWFGKQNGARSATGAATINGGGQVFLSGALDGIRVLVSGGTANQGNLVVGYR